MFHIYILLEVYSLLIKILLHFIFMYIKYNVQNIMFCKSCKSNGVKCLKKSLTLPLTFFHLLIAKFSPLLNVSSCHSYVWSWFFFFFLCMLFFSLHIIDVFYTKISVAMLLYSCILPKIINLEWHLKLLQSFKKKIQVFVACFKNCQYLTSIHVLNFSIYL